MGTLVCFHAHPDDEAIATGGTMARAVDEGHRVVLVVATDGVHGEVPADLAEGESLVDRRRAETYASAEALGIHRVVFFDYHDSGMTGWDANGHDHAFANADLDEAARRLAEVLREEAADVLTIYDWHGGYGHPDHIQVHRVGCRAEELVRDDLPALRVLESTMNRDEMRRWIETAEEIGLTELGPEGDDGQGFNPDGPMDDGNPMGTPEAELTLGVDVSPFIERKRASISAHRSQVTDSSFFLQLPIDAFTLVFGREWFIEHDREPGPRTGWIFDDA
jgi:LmbE family N-acetylglucosaminyl deacetylase